jgi:phosphohistidine phosphatase
MRLLIVRHAKAFERDASAWPDDLRRPLTAGGRNAFIQLAKRLGEVVPNVECILASPATRAWQTARLLHEHTGWPAPEKTDALLPDGELVLLRDSSLFRQDAKAPIVWVGHEPELSRTASWLLTADPARLTIDFKKGAALMLEIDVAALSAPAGRAHLDWLVTPRFARRKKS